MSSIRLLVIAVAAASATLSAMGNRAFARQDRPFQDAVQDLNPVLYWVMDEGAGSSTAEDYAGNNDGSHQGNPLPTTGEYPFTRDDGDASVEYNVGVTGQSTLSPNITTTRQPGITLVVLMRSTIDTQS